MKFLPYERFRIRTSLSSQEAVNRLENAIEPKRFFRFFGASEKPYEGKLEGSHFEISRIIGYRNSFLPRIKGDVESEISGCSISISMQPHVFVITFMIFWLGGVGFAFLAALGSFVSSLGQTSTADPSFLLIPGGMFIFGYLMVLGGFKFESVKSKKFFQRLFEEEEVEEMGFANPFEAAG
ncbi:MAG: hypothetical protein CVU44_08045 [Chloroflexi bacterium HGW-Chloroflexi-6]|nr:MAG: hypothetical protein CVU44_08045 [Chloroflexi bacterium HGW-Chloroflexi-6]